MTVSVPVCARLSSHARERERGCSFKAKPKKKIAFRRPITVERAKDQDLQLSYINPAESGCRGHFALLSKLAASRSHTAPDDGNSAEF